MRKFLALALVAFIAIGLFAGCGEPEDDTITIGISFGTLNVERWVKEKEFMENLAKEMGVNVVFQDGQDDATIQHSQIENLISQKVDSLIILAVDTTLASRAVDLAYDAGIPVVCYGRMIESNKLEAYVGFVVRQLGVDIATPLLEAVPKGNIAIILGADTDVNSHLMRDGVYDVYQPAIDRGDINIVFEQFTQDWSPENAMAHVENALTATNNDIQGIISLNDGMAGGIIAALRAQGLDGVIPVTGGDGELAAMQRIVEGSQLMTLYYPVMDIAKEAFLAAVELAEGTSPPSGINHVTDTDLGPIPTINVFSVLITKDNIIERVVDTGIFTFEEVYANIPEADRPAR